VLSKSLPEGGVILVDRDGESMRLTMREGSGETLEKVGAPAGTSEEPAADTDES
jgi:hypothetical protein